MSRVCRDGFTWHQASDRVTSLRCFWMSPCWVPSSYSVASTSDSSVVLFGYRDGRRHANKWQVWCQLWRGVIGPLERSGGLYLSGFGRSLRASDSSGRLGLAFQAAGSGCRQGLAWMGWPQCWRIGSGTASKWPGFSWSNVSGHGQHGRDGCVCRRPVCSGCSGQCRS